MRDLSEAMSQNQSLPKKTSLYDEHIRLGARMIPFAGFEMPVWYSSQIDEHLAVRERVGIFDLSHMGEVFIRGKEALRYLQYITTNDVSRLSLGRCHYTTLLYDDGGIVDDLIVYRSGDEEFFAVVNASNIEKDFQWMRANAGPEGASRRLADSAADFEALDLVNLSDEYSLIAVQGPLSERVLLEAGFADVSDMKPFSLRTVEDDTGRVFLCATGYTGERGFELILENEGAVPLWRRLFPIVRELGGLPVGLGARDTLRLEMCYMLYGNDISEKVSPLEAGLAWVVKFDKGPFIGREPLLKQKEKGIPRRIIPFTAGTGRAPRHEMKVFREDGEEVGVVTSGSLSPSLKQNVGMAIVKVEPGGEVLPGSVYEVAVGDKRVKITTVKPPIYKGKAAS